MKKLLLSAIFIVLWNVTWAQKTYYQPVIIYPASDNTIIRKDGQEIKLDNLLVCQHNEKVEVIKGKIKLFDGENEDIELNTGKHVIIKKKNIKDKSNKSIIDKISRFINEPSIYLPNLYNYSRSHFPIFPLESKVYNTSSIKFYTYKKNTPEKKLKIYYKDSLVYETNNKINKSILEKILKPNYEYSWNLNIGPINVNGEFELLSEEQKKDLNLIAAISARDYIKLYFIYLENGCKFDAICILIEAYDKFPENKIFKNLIDRFPFSIN